MGRRSFAAVSAAVVLAAAMFTASGQTYNLGVAHQQHGVDDAAADYSDILFWFNGEAAGSQSPPVNCSSETYTFDSSNEYPASETNSGGNSGWQINTGAALSGIYGFDQDSGVERCEFTVTADDLFDTSSGRVCFQVTVTANPTTTFRLFSAIDSGGGDHFFIETVGGNDLEGNWNDGTNDASTTGSWNGFTTSSAQMFVEVAYDVSTERIDIYIDGSQQGSGCSSCSMDALTGIDRVYVGGNLAHTASVHMDVVVISNDPDRDCYALVETGGITDYPG